MVMFNVSPGQAKRRRKQNSGRRRDKNALSSHVVLFLYQVSSQAQLKLEATNGAGV